MLSQGVKQQAEAHLLRLTDATGVIEHARYSQPYAAEGYTTDDNARAFQATLGMGKRLAKYRGIYLRFLQRAVAPSGFYNDMNINGFWVDDPGTGEWSGRAMRAVAQGMKKGNQQERSICQQIWTTARPAVL